MERQAGQRGSWLADTRWLVMASRRGRGSFSMAGLGSRPSSGDTELTLGQSLQQRAPVGSARAVASARPAPAPCALAVRLTPADGAVHCVPVPRTARAAFAPWPVMPLLLSAWCAG